MRYLRRHVPLGAHDGSGQTGVGRDQVEHLGGQRAVAGNEVVQLTGYQVACTGMAAQTQFGPGQAYGTEEGHIGRAAGVDRGTKGRVPPGSRRRAP